MELGMGTGFTVHGFLQKQWLVSRVGATKISADNDTPKNGDTRMKPVKFIILLTIVLSKKVG
jgi:hypothetical protein